MKRTRRNRFDRIAMVAMLAWVIGFCLGPTFGSAEESVGGTTRQLDGWQNGKFGMMECDSKEMPVYQSGRANHPPIFVAVVKCSECMGKCATAYSSCRGQCAPNDRACLIQCQELSSQCQQNCKDIHQCE